jgi:hypothetical protein
MEFGWGLRRGALSSPLEPAGYLLHLEPAVSGAATGEVSPLPLLPFFILMKLFLHWLHIRWF